MVQSVGAAVSPVTREELQNRPSVLVSQGTHRRLSRAHSLMAKNKLDQAIDALKALEGVTAKRPGELAQVLQALGFAYAQKDKTILAIQTLQKALNLKTLPYSPTLSTMYTLAQMYMSGDKYTDAEQVMNNWFRLAEDPSPDAFVVMASIQSQKGNKKKALELVTKAIDSSTKPKESWLSFAVSMNYELDRFQEAARILEKLTAFFPEKKKYWKQLAGVYLNINNNQKALATLGLAGKGGYLTEEGEILNHVSLNLYGGVPYRAGQILEKAIKEKKVKGTQKNYEILGDCWAQAEDMTKALAAYRESAKRSKDGRIFAKQGRIYLEMEKWIEAEKSLSQSLSKGGVKKPASIHMALGISRFNLKKWQSAVQSFEKAGVQNKKLKEQSSQWISFVKTEQERLNPTPAAAAEETSLSL